MFGTANKPEQCIQNIKLTKSAWDSNFMSVNPKFVAVAWESGGMYYYTLINPKFRVMDAM